MSQIQDQYRLAVIMGFLLGVVLAPVPAGASGKSTVSGQISDPQGRVVANAKVRLVVAASSFQKEAVSDAQGRFAFDSLHPGVYQVTAEAPGFTPITMSVEVKPDEVTIADLQFTTVAAQAQSVTVTEDVTDKGVFNPDPAQWVLLRQETLDANPGRPDMPISIPGMPVESPAGGIKPP